jgi:putative ATP-dependent endonuclease of the OLD family
MFKKRMLQLDDINYRSKEDFKKAVINESIAPKDIVFPEVEIKIIFEDMNIKQLAVVGDLFCDTSLKRAMLTYVFKPRTAFNKIEWVEVQRKRITKIKNDKGNFELKDFLNAIEFPINQYEYTIYGGMDSTNRCDPYFLRMLKLEVLDALRDAKRELIANGDSKLLYKVLNRNNDAYTDVKDVLSKLDEMIKNNRQLNDIKKKVMVLLEQISLQEQEDQNHVDFNFSSPETSEILKKLSLIYGKDPISIERNGLGRNNLLYISLVLSQFTSDDYNDEIPFRVVEIEEPEAHLHPHLQKHLSKNIESINEKADDLKIILTSHSPEYNCSKS